MTSGGPVRYTPLLLPPGAEKEGEKVVNILSEICCTRWIGFRFHETHPPAEQSLNGFGLGGSYLEL